MARVVAHVPDLLFGSKVQGMLAAAGHDVALVASVDGARKHAGAVDVLVVDLFFEPDAGIALLEAMSCGCPPIAAAVGGVPEIQNDPSVGWLIPPGDENALLSAMRAALNLEDDRSGVLHDGQRLGHGADAHAVHLRDDVVGTQPTLGGRAAGVDAHDEQAGHAAGRVLDDLRAFEYGVERRLFLLLRRRGRGGGLLELAEHGFHGLLAAVADQADRHFLAGRQQADGITQRA